MTNNKTAMSKPKLKPINAHAAAIQTVNAGFWEMVLVRIFGKKLICADNCSSDGKYRTIIHARYYWGKIYFMKHEEVKGQKQWEILN